MLAAKFSLPRKAAELPHAALLSEGNGHVSHVAVRVAHEGRICHALALQGRTDSPRVRGTNRPDPEAVDGVLHDDRAAIRDSGHDVDVARPEVHVAPVNVNPKVVAAGAAGAVTVVLVWVASPFNVTVPPEVASAITVLVSVAAGYLQPAKPGLSPIAPSRRSAKGLTLLETLVVLLIVLVVLLLIGVVH